MKKNQINTKKQRMYKQYKSLNEFIKIQIIYKYNYEKLCFKRKKINDNKVIIKIKESFYILRNHNYMDKFYECLKKHNLYEEYCEYSSDYYNYVFKEWCKIHNINLKV